MGRTERIGLPMCTHTASTCATPFQSASASMDDFEEACRSRMLEHIRAGRWLLVCLGEAVWLVAHHQQGLLHSPPPPPPPPPHPLPCPTTTRRCSTAPCCCASTALRSRTSPALVPPLRQRPRLCSPRPPCRLGPAFPPFSRSRRPAPRTSAADPAPTPRPSDPAVVCRSGSAVWLFFSASTATPRPTTSSTALVGLAQTSTQNVSAPPNRCFSISGHPAGDLEAPEYFFEHYPDRYPDMAGSIIPFALRLAHAGPSVGRCPPLPHISCSSINLLPLVHSRASCAH